MSDENKGAPAPTPADALKNMKAEFDRKIANLESTNKKLVDQMIMLSKPAQQTSAPAKAIEEVIFDDPRKAVEMIKQELRQESAGAQRVNSTITKLVQEFPELNDETSDLTKRAVEIYESLNAEDKTSPLAYRAAVREAAQEQGVQPMSKRKSSDDDTEYSLPGSGANRARTDSKGTRSRDTLSDNTVEFAKRVGVDADDPKVKERLKGYAKRTWKHYGK